MIEDPISPPGKWSRAHPQEVAQRLNYVKPGQNWKHVLSPLMRFTVDQVEKRLKNRK